MFGKNPHLTYSRKIGRYLSGIAKIQLREIEFVTFNRQRGLLMYIKLFNRTLA